MAVTTGRDIEAARRTLAAWLSDRLGGTPVRVGDIAIPGLSGFSNETLLFDATWDDGDGAVVHGLVVRVEPTGHQVFPSTEFDTQARVLRALHHEGSVPVPTLRWFEDDPSVLGARFMVMDRVEGRVPPDNPSYHADGWFPALPPALQEQVWWSGLDAMAAVHRIDREGAGLGWLPARTPAEQLALDRDYVAFAAGDLTLPHVGEALEALEATTPPPAASPALCWGDSRIGNVIFDDDGRAAAVLDWEMVTVGDPIQDLAWYLLIDRHHHEGFGVPRLPALPDRAATVARWEQATGRSAEHLYWYELLGAVRYAAVVTRVVTVIDELGVMPGMAAMAADHTGTALLGRLLEEWS